MIAKRTLGRSGARTPFSPSPRSRASTLCGSASQKRRFCRLLTSSGSHQWVVFGPVRNLRFAGPDGVVRYQLEGRVSCDDMAFAHHAVLHGCGLGVLPCFLPIANTVRLAAVLRVRGQLRLLDLGPY